MRRHRPPTPAVPHDVAHDAAHDAAHLTSAQVLFLVEGDRARLAAYGCESESAGVVLASTALAQLVTAWATTFASDRRLGIDCEIPAWTPALAEAKRIRDGAAERDAETMEALVDYLAFRPRTPRPGIIGLLFDRHGSPETPGPDLNLERHTFEMRAAKDKHEAAETAYQAAMRHAVAVAPGR